MASIAIRLDPQLFDNPDADIRFVLLDLLTERPEGIIRDDGWDCVGSQPLMVVFLTAIQPAPALACVLDVIENTPVIGRVLGARAVVAVECETGWEVVYPPGCADPLLPESILGKGWLRARPGVAPA